MKNKSTRNSKKLLKEIIAHHEKNIAAIRSRLSEFRSIPPSEYFYELVYCLLTPQSSAANADQAVGKLRMKGFHIHNIDPEPILGNKEHYIRFHRTKSRHLIKMKEQFPDIARKLSEKTAAFDLRDWLAREVTGLGYKEATHFLRNIGKNDGLSILDRHILRALKGLNIIGSIPKSMSKNEYLRIEGKFGEFAEKIGIVLDELDIVIWSKETGEIRK